MKRKILKISTFTLLSCIGIAVSALTITNINSINNKQEDNTYKFNLSSAKIAPRYSYGSSSFSENFNSYSYIQKGEVPSYWLTNQLDNFTTLISQDINKKINSKIKKFLLVNTDMLLLKNEINKIDWFQLSLKSDIKQFNDIPDWIQYGISPCGINNYPHSNLNYRIGLDVENKGITVYPFQWIPSKELIISKNKKTLSFGSKANITSSGPSLNIFKRGEYSPTFELPDTYLGYKHRLSSKSEHITTKDFHLLFTRPWANTWINNNLINWANITNTFYFEFNLSKLELTNDPNNPFSCGIKSMNIDEYSWDVIGDNPYKFTWIWNGRGNPEIELENKYWDVALHFNNPQVTITLPYDVYAIKQNISNFLNQTISNDVWFDDYTEIAEKLKKEAYEYYVPSYLKDAINIKYTPNYRTEAIDWDISWTTWSGDTNNYKATTRLNLPERLNLAQVYKELLNYIQVPIKLFSNSSLQFDNPSIPTFINNKFDKELLKPVGRDLPRNYGYVVSSASDVQIGTSGQTNYYLGNNKTLSATPQWSNTERIVPNRTILLNYVKMLMTNFWNKYGTSFKGADADAIISFSTEKKGTNKQNYINIQFIFRNLSNSSVINNQPSPWEFKIPVQVITTGFVNAAGVEERLIFEGSKVPFIDPIDNKVKLKYQTDQVPATCNDGFRIAASDGRGNGGVRLFFSSVKMNFTVDTAQNEEISVNGVKLPVKDYQVETTLAGPNELNDQGNNQNGNSQYSGFKEYNISVVNSGSEIYKVKIYIGNSSTPTDISYYGWDPGKNPDQKILISPKNEDGTDNPKYVPELDPKNGVINELLWVNQPINDPNHKVAMWSDPYDEFGKPTGNSTIGWVQNGFLAQGLVVDKGVKINFDNLTGNVKRTGLDFNADNGFVLSSNPTKNPNQQFQNCGITTSINPSSPLNPYYSLSGKWVYTVKSKFPDQQPKINDFGTFGQYFVNVVDVSNIDNPSGVVLAKFTDTLPQGQKIVVPFWESYHGYNLKNYLTNNYGLKETEIMKMGYNDVLGWWNQYCYDGFNLQISNDRVKNLSSLFLNGIKTSTNDKAKLKQDIIDNVIFQMKEYNLVYNSQYQINIDDAELDRLIKSFNNLKRDNMFIEIVAMENQDLVKGSKKLQVINDPNLLNLSDIYIPKLAINNTSKNIDDLKQDIINELNEIFSQYRVKDENGNPQTVDLIYGIDFIVDWTNLTQILIDENNSTRAADFKITAINSSKYLAGSNTFNVLNSTQINKQEMVNFNKIRVQNIEFNIGKKDVEKTKIILSNYIFAAVRNAFEEYFKDTNNPGLSQKNKLMFEWNENIYSLDQIVFPKGYGEYWSIPNLEIGLNELIKNIDKPEFSNVFTFTIQGIRDSLIARGGSVFRITNSYLNSTNPNVPNMPENPNDLIPDPPSPQDLGWIAAIVVPVGLISIGLVSLLIYRWKTRKIK